MKRDQSSSDNTTRVSAQYFPVPIDALCSLSLTVDLYLVHESGKVALYRAMGSSYSTADNEELMSKGITHFYISFSQHHQFQEAIVERFVNAYEDPAIGRHERTRIVRDSCERMISDFMRRTPHAGAA